MLSRSAKLLPGAARTGLRSAGAPRQQAAGLLQARPVSTQLGGCSPSVPVLTYNLPAVLASGTRPFSSSAVRHVCYIPDPYNPAFVVDPRCGKFQDDLYTMYPANPIKKVLCKYLLRREFPIAMFKEACTDIVQACSDMDYKGFLQVTGSKDEIETYFYFFHMHAWFFARRIHREGVIGADKAYNYFWRAFWDLFDGQLDTFRREMRYREKVAIRMSEEFYSRHYIHCMMYERAIHSPDSYLAHVLAHILFDKEECVNPESLLLLCHYWRQQVAAVDSMTPKQLFCEPNHVFPNLIESPDAMSMEEKFSRLFLVNKKVSLTGKLNL